MRRFTVEEANALIPTLVPLLERLRESALRFVEARRYVRARVAGNGGGARGKELLDASTESRAALREIAELGVHVRDPGTGLVDFPAERHGRDVYLCWRLGEPRVEWWHPTDTGVAGRKRLDER